jgi:putative exosortase-associated protein (TIGR04073 family)
MMKTKSLLSLMMVGMVVMALAGPRDVSAQQDMAAKFNRGAANTALGILEIPGCVKDGVRKNGALEGYTLGFFKGVMMMPVRTVVGIYEWFTFYIPSQPVLEPETPLHYFYEDWEPQRAPVSGPPPK